MVQRCGNRWCEGIGTPERIVGVPTQFRPRWDMPSVESGRTRGHRVMWKAEGCGSLAFLSMACKPVITPSASVLFTPGHVYTHIYFISSFCTLDHGLQLHVVNLSSTSLNIFFNFNTKASRSSRECCTFIGNVIMCRGGRLLRFLVGWELFTWVEAEGESARE